MCVILKMCHGDWAQNQIAEKTNKTNFRPTHKTKNEHQQQQQKQKFNNNAHSFVKTSNRKTIMNNNSEHQIQNEWNKTEKLLLIWTMGEGLISFNISITYNMV